MKKIVATNTRYPEDVHQAMVRLATKHERSFNAEVMWALRQYIEREEGKQDVSGQAGRHRQDKTT